MHQVTYVVGFPPEVAASYACPGIPAAEILDLESVDIRNLPPPKTPSVTMLARTSADLRRAMAVDDRMPAATRVELRLGGIPCWRPPPLPAPGDEGLWRHLTGLSAQFGEQRQWIVTATFAQPVPSGEVLGSIARTLDGHRVGGVGPLTGPTGPGTMSSIAPDLPGLSKPAVHLTRQALRDMPTLRDLGANGASGTVIPPVDERSINPIGFTRNPAEGTGELHGGPDGYRICVGSREWLRLPRSGAVTDVDIERLRPLRGVRGLLTSPDHGGLGLARVVVALAAAGVPLTGTPAPGWASVLGEVPLALIASVSEDDLANPLTREQHSIRLRRWALRQHGTRAHWQRLLADRGISALPEPLVSVLLCSRRPAMIEAGLRQAARQRDVRSEVILTLHGIPADDERVTRATAAFDGPLTVVEVDGAVSFGEALNFGAARASGAFIARMDDDDWYGADYLSDALLAHLYSGADLIGCCGSFAYLESMDVTVHKDQPEHLAESPHWMALEAMNPGEHLTIPGATIFVSRTAFEAVGGFKPVHIFEDTELMMSIAAAGGRVHRMHGLNFMFRRRDPSEHTWQVSESEFLDAYPRCWPGLYFNDLMGIAAGEES
jgi:Glycosyltransferase like family 2